MGDIADDIFDEGLEHGFAMSMIRNGLIWYGCQSRPIQVVPRRVGDDTFYTCAGTCEKCERDGKHLAEP